MSESLDDYGKTKLKQKYSRIDALNEVDYIIKARTWDIVGHFVKNCQGTGMKGQIVVGKKWQTVPVEIASGSKGYSLDRRAH